MSVTTPPRAIRLWYVFDYLRQPILNFLPLISAHVIFAFAITSQPKYHLREYTMMAEMSLPDLVKMALASRCSGFNRLLSAAEHD
jgi:hypothetical protein